MKFTIRKGKHRAWPPVFGLFWNKKKMERIVSFDITAKYELSATDQDDVNKLFGFGFLPGHHTDSVRFGWNYNNGTSKVIIFAYCYVNGARVIEYIGEVLTHRAILLSISKIGNLYSFNATDVINSWHSYGSCDISFTHKKRLSYKLGCYFGGNNPSPHKINIEIKKK